jgi:hypothetical protein
MPQPFANGSHIDNAEIIANQLHAEQVDRHGESSPPDRQFGHIIRSRNLIDRPRRTTGMLHSPWTV